ncbi:MAG: PD-(D/E)XK nuclease family protein [Firmicutes bacterium]|nr:PD-(D/E)XK nuclease family protein [Bacillota bacterium]
MALKMILGAAGTGKTAYCLNRIVRALTAEPMGRPQVLIVPEQATFVYERMLAQLCPGGGFSGAEVSSFQRLCLKAAQSLNLPLPPSLSDSGKTLLLKKLIRSRRQELTTFHSAYLQNGFLSNLRSLLEEFHIYNVRPEQLLEIAQTPQPAAWNGRFGDKLQDVALLYQDYLQALNKGYGSYPQALDILAQAVREGGFLSGADIFIDGYYQFTPKELTVIAAWQSRAASLNITLPLDAGEALSPLGEEQVFYPAWHCYSQIRRLAEQSGAAEEAPALLPPGQGRFAGGNEICPWERALANPSLPLEPALPAEQAPGQIRLGQATGRRQEITAVGREIIRLTREEGLRYRDIAIILRSPEPYEQLLPQIFDEMDIPYFIDSRKSLFYHPLIEFCRAALEIWAYQPRQEQIFRYLKNPLSPLTPEQCDILENYCLANGVQLWHWRQETPWTGERGLEQWDVSLQEIDTWRRQGYQAVQRFCAALGKQAAGAQICQALLALLDQTGVADTLQTWAEQAAQQGDGSQSQIHRQAWASLEQLLNESAALLGDTPLQAEEAISLLDGAWQNLTVSLTPPGLDQVFVSALERSVHPPVQAAFVLNVNDGVFPQKIDEDGLFGLTERRLLAKAHIMLAPDGRQRQLAENFLAYLAFTRCGQRLYISYIQKEDDGTACPPSPLISRLQALYPGLVAENLDEPEDWRQLCGGGMDAAALAKQLSQAAQGQSISPFWYEAYRWYEENPQAAPELSQIHQGLRFQAQAGRLAPGVSRRLYGGQISGSVSRLEKFRACPFAFFAGYTLGLRPRLRYQITPADRGELFHQSLAEMGRMLKQRQMDWSRVDEKLAEDLSEKAFAQYAPQFLSGILASSSRYRYISRRFRRALSASFLLAARHIQGGKFIPAAFELPFGDDKQGLPALVIDLPEGRKLKLYGQIDRVDKAQGLDKTWFRIVDYKTGRASMTPSDIFNGIRLQLLLYLQTVLTNSFYFTDREAAAAGVYYAPVRDDFNGGADGDDASEMRLNGLTVKDEEAVVLADRDINGFSRLIQVAYSEKSGFYANSPGVSQEQLRLLLLHLRQLLTETAEQMYQGLIEAHPRRLGGRLACDLCDQRQFCGLDREFAPVNESEKLSDGQIWQKLAEEQGEKQKEENR